MKAITTPELFQLVFLQIAINHKPSNAWFTLDDAIFHTAIFKLQQEYGKTFPPLEKLHFMTAGAFPYSHELSDAISSLKAGYLATLIMPRMKKYYYCRLLGKDSGPFLAKAVEDIFQDDSLAKESFQEFVLELWATIRRCPYPVT